MSLTRRRFLQLSAAGGAAFFLPPGLARAATSRNVLVVCFLRGGADGLHAVVPFADPEYATLRPTLAVPSGTLLPLDGFFGLHPDLAELAPLYASGQLAVVHCCGSPNETRSHFDAQDFMERAAPGNKSIADGWLNRYLSFAGGGSPLAGVSLAWSKELALDGPAPNLSMNSISSFQLSGGFDAEREAAIRQMHGAPGLVQERTAETFDVVQTLAGVSTQTSVVYPDNDFGRRLRDVAALIRADVGLHVAAVSIGGWDNHSDQLTGVVGPMRGLATGLAAFQQDLGGDASRVVTLVMTEFGRTVEENGSFGTDHGRGSAMLALGGGLAGGRVILKDDVWPGLTPNTGWPRRDLDVTTDFRDVFAEVLDRHMAVVNPSAVLPNFTASPSNYPGLWG